MDFNRGIKDACYLLERSFVVLKIKRTYANFSQNRFILRNRLVRLITFGLDVRNE